MTKTICVIGCSGFVGSHVTAELLSQGFSVHGSLRDPNSEDNAWVKEKLAPLATGSGKLSLFMADLFDKDSLKSAMVGCDGVIACAGSPKVEPETIELMQALADNVSDAALELGIGKVVFTSSTGSTNPPEGEPEIKNEIDHWSDDSVQLESKKFAAVGKTRLDRTVLKKAEESSGKLIVCTINPSMILGQRFNSNDQALIRVFGAIVKGKRMGDKIPNGSMSFIDVCDLAKLHIAALLNEDASGRYFGVVNSWHWRDILGALENRIPSYSKPAVDPEEVPVKATSFDFTRRDSLGIALKSFDEMMDAIVNDLKANGVVD